MQYTFKVERITELPVPRYTVLASCRIEETPGALSGPLGATREGVGKLITDYIHVVEA